MRVILPAALLLLAGCDIDNDPADHTVTVRYDREKIRKSAVEAESAAKAVATGVGNVAKDTGRAIKREVGDIDVDVKVRRTRNEPADQSK